MKICSASPEALNSILRRVMMLVGLRAANLPSREETQILRAFIYKKFGGFTLEEIQLAFEKAVAGELECEANCYENFSAQYFGQIMSAYKKWASQKFNENQMYLVKPKETNLIIMPADWKELCEINYQKFLSGSYNIFLWPHQLYDEFVRCQMMAEDVYEDYLKPAYCVLIARDCSTNAEKDLLFDIQRKGVKHTRVIELAKRLSVEYLYKHASKKGYKNLFVKQ